MKTSEIEKAIEEISDIVGYNNVKTDEATKLVYSYDASMVRAKPCGVININDIELISPVVKVLYSHSIPYTPRLAGTNLSGGATNQKGGFVINLCGCDRIRRIDTEKKIAVVEPGVVNLKLQKELEKFGFFYPPDPASQKVSTIGGNIAENAGGPQCLKYGVTSNNIIRLDMVLPDGTEAHFDLNDKGPQIISLFAGSEGTLGIVKKAYLKILPIPKYFLTVYSEFKTLEDSMKAVTDTIKKGIIPKALEVTDRLSIKAAGKENEINKETEAMLITEIDSDSEEEIKSQKEEIIKIFNSNGALKTETSSDKNKSEELWKLRKEAYPSLAKIANNILVEDGCVPRSELVSTVRKIKRILEENAITAGLVFHAGDGNIHPNIVFDERDVKETNRIRKAAKEIIKEYITAGGTISAEHGVGVEKRGFILLQHSKETINLIRRIKKEMDEKNVSNPDKKIPVRNDFEKLERIEFEISENVKILIKEIKKRYEEKIPTAVTGYGTQLKEIPQNVEKIDTMDLKKVLNFDKDNMTITAEAGMKAKNLVDFLKSEGFYIPIPPSESSLGGIIARNDFLELRDLILSMDIILSNGEFARFGGKNIKDNSVYDIPKLMIGSMGSLGIITSVSFKIFKENRNFKITKTRNVKNITPVHIKIKKAFDPDNLFNPFMTEELYGAKL
ncbi:MAG TPA: FAD-linked oxidase C-terminal domain-containing protein [Elusimicrobiales bacterium]|nr:FAD-linked oxidase C-terminal domain-containing protein [Elusimicrobiales bacterium]HOL62925.1 FAD-linked oxidase C-terminal domain-containing protein [Elusimicrobiales bacterium]HPO95824.1 FAD-linked oxidase C-terminal domain-containing protein [Elusimicrobiales bacterium]